MSVPFARVLRASALGVIVVVHPVGADALTVGRCNMLVDGVYKPVLVVDNDGQKTVHQIGEDGLTRRIAFNDTAAMAWAAAQYGADEVTYSEACRSSGDPVVRTDPPVIEEEVEEEGGYGGYEEQQPA